MNYYRPTESDLYKNGSTITTSNINKQNAEKAKMFDELRSRKAFNDAVRANLDRAAEEGRQYGIQEGATAAYTDIANKLNTANQRNNKVTGLYDEVERLTAQKSSLYPSNAELAAKDIESMRQDSYNSAFIAAEKMGDTSENNINKLVIQELNKRGL